MSRTDEISARLKSTRSLEIVHSWAPADLMWLLSEVAALRETLRAAAEQFEALADEAGCEAGNWDGGSAATCEHCQLRASAATFRALAESEASQ